MPNVLLFNMDWCDYSDFQSQEYSLAGITRSEYNSEKKMAPTIDEILDGLWHMGVPKSKVCLNNLLMFMKYYHNQIPNISIYFPFFQISHSRKRMGHGRYIPKKVEWHTCDRCGQARRPHRVCRKHIDICALREDEWLVLKKKTTDVPSSQA